MAAVCVDVRAQLEALVDGELPAARAGAVRRHLSECAACRVHHAEASSLRARIAAVGGPEPPTALLAGVLGRVRRERIGPVRLWAPLAVELALSVVALWYVSGFDGLSTLVQHTTADVGAVVGWGLGEAELPAPAGGDVFLLLVCALLLVTTLYHLALLSRQGQRLS